MKEIKFRGKRKETGEWAYGFYYEKPSGKSYIYNNQTLSHFRVDPETVGQYTTRNDIHNREIYKGDRLRITMYDRTTRQEIAQQESIVEFRYGMFGVKWSGVFTALAGFSHNVRLEVIGTKYDEEVQN